MKKEKKNKKENTKVNIKLTFLVILLLFFLVLFVVGVTYQIFLYTDQGESVWNKIFGVDGDVFKNGSVTIVYTEGDNRVRITDAVPMSDEEGKNITRKDYLMDFTVSINITKKSEVTYQVVAEKDKNSTIEDKYIKIYLQRGLENEKYDEVVLEPTRFTPVKEENDFGVPIGDMILDEVTSDKDIKYYYRLRLWIASDYQLDNTYKYFTIKINVYGKGQRVRKNNTSNTTTKDNTKNTTDTKNNDNNKTDNKTTDETTENNNTTDTTKEEK